MSRTAETFSLGRVVATPGALHALGRAKETALTYLTRHAGGNWGEVDSEDARANDRARETGRRLFSSYTLRDGTKLWIITEADRASTCILLPEEY
jgi:hypothetical protein